MKRLIILTLILFSCMLVAGNLAIHNEDGILTCDTAGIAYIASTQAYGTWEFDFNKCADGNTSVYQFLGANTKGWRYNSGYMFYATSTESILLYSLDGVGGSPILIHSANSYIDNNTDYPIIINRLEEDGTFPNVTGEAFESEIYEAGNFAVYINKGAGYELVAPDGIAKETDGSYGDTKNLTSNANPVNDNTYTT